MMLPLGGRVGERAGTAIQRSWIQLEDPVPAVRRRAPCPLSPLC